MNFIRSLQEAGGGILDTGLQDLADLTRVNQKLSGILKKLYFVIGFSLLLDAEQRRELSDLHDLRQ